MKKQRSTLTTESNPLFKIVWNVADNSKRPVTLYQLTTTF
jgi:hypothetical protein